VIEMRIFYSISAFCIFFFHTQAQWSPSFSALKQTQTPISSTYGVNPIAQFQTQDAPLGNSGVPTSETILTTPTTPTRVPTSGILTPLPLTPQPATVVTPLPTSIVTPTPTAVLTPVAPTPQILIPVSNQTVPSVPVSGDTTNTTQSLYNQILLPVSNRTVQTDAGFTAQQGDEENSDIRSLPRSPPIDPVDESSYELMVELLASNATNSNVTGTQTIQFTFIPFSRNVENVKLIYTNQTMNDDSMTSDGDADMDQMNSQTVEMSQEKPQIWRKKINLPFNSQINYLISYDVNGRNRNTTINTLEL